MLAQQKRPDIGYFNQKARFLDGIGSISITRVVTPPVGAESVYQAVAGVVKSVSRPTQREIIKAILSIVNAMYPPFLSVHATHPDGQSARTHLWSYLQENRNDSRPV